jgi:hypothetical protein
MLETLCAHDTLNDPQFGLHLRTIEKEHLEECNRSHTYLFPGLHTHTHTHSLMLHVHSLLELLSSGFASVPRELKPTSSAGNRSSY